MLVLASNSRMSLSHRPSPLARRQFFLRDLLLGTLGLPLPLTERCRSHLRQSDYLSDESDPHKLLSVITNHTRTDTVGNIPSDQTESHLLLIALQESQ
jgi:hypothetical protein